MQRRRTWVVAGALLIGTVLPVVCVVADARAKDAARDPAKSAAKDDIAKDAAQSAANDAADAAARDRRRTPVVEVIERCRDAVVNISTTRVVRTRSLYGSPLGDIFDFGRPRPSNQRVESVGSGVVVHEDGFIVTNAHVVSQASDVHVTFADGTTQPATVVATDSEHDLAVLKTGASKPLPCQKLGRSDDVMIGETVVAIGNPMGLGHTVTCGIVSAVNRDLDFGADVVYRGLIQIDAPINPGNSGGPLLNLNGELIGINSAIRGDAQNIGFAIPVNRIWELLPSMLDIERRERVRFGLQVGGKQAEVTEVRPDTPAAGAGLQRGDRVVRVNGHAVRDGIDYYVRLLDQKPGGSVALAVLRGGKEVDVSVPLQTVPVPNGQELASKLLGVDLRELTNEQRRKYDLPPQARLVVAGVTPDGPGDHARMIPTDVIIGVNRVPVASLDDVGLALEQVRPGQRVVVEGLRLDAEWPWRWSVVLLTGGHE